MCRANLCMLGHQSRASRFGLLRVRRIRSGATDWRWQSWKSVTRYEKSARLGVTWGRLRAEELLERLQEPESKAAATGEALRGQPNCP